MAHNVSPRMRHDRIMDGRLSNWFGHRLAMRCDGPGHGKRILHPAVELLEAARPGQTVAWWVQRAICRECGGPFAGVALRRLTSPDTLGADDWIYPLRGPGTQAGDQREVSCDTAQYAWWRSVPWLQESTPRGRRRR